MTKIILASTSKYRKALLERLGVPFECIAPEVDENQYKIQINDPVKLAEILAYAKAQAIFEKYPNDIVIGSDQVATFESKILSKTGSLEKSFEQLKLMSGKSHRLITSYCVMAPNQVIEKTNITTLRMRKLSDLQIKNYLRIDNPFDCAGSYKLELNGISLFESIDTTDHAAVVGLPLIELGNDLNKLGVMIPPES